MQVMPLRLWGILLPLIFPGLVAQGRPVEFLAVVLPQRHETVHIGDETIVVMALEQMNHFMDNDVLYAMNRFLDKLEIQPDAACLDIASAPFGFHLFHAPLGHLHADNRFPFSDQGSNLLLEPPAIPGIQYALPLRSIAAGPPIEIHGCQLKISLDLTEGKFVVPTQ